MTGWATKAREEAIEYMARRADDIIRVTEAGPRNARTDPGSGLRYYTWGDRTDLLSVTSARTEAGMPHGLHQWTLSQVIDRAVDDHAGFHAILERPVKPRERVRDKNVLRELRQWLRAAATEERDRSAALGTAVHDYAAQGIVPDTVPEVTEIADRGKVHSVTREEILPRLSWYIGWLRASGATILGREFQVFNLTEGYAGSCDLLVRFADGSVWIVDLKTGDGTYFEHALQVSAYRHGEFVGRDGIVDEGLTALLRQVSATATLHLGEHGWEFVKVRSDETVYRAFLGVLTFARASLELAHDDSYVLARRRFPDPGQSIVDDMARELERRKGAAA